MHHSRNNDSIHVGENLFEVFAMFRRGRRQRGTNRSGFVVRRDTQITDVLTKVGDPIRELVKLRAKNLRRRVARWISILH